MAYFDRDHPTFLADAVSAADHVRGPDSADVTLVEFGDFACPSCGESYGMIKALLARRRDLRFVFRANPRSHLFPHAEIAAEAAEAAAAQGKFWEMHDLLFENQAALSRPEISRLAGTLGLDLARFDRKLDAGTHRAAVRAQEVSGWHSHVLSTPTFFVNGVRFEDAPARSPPPSTGRPAKIGSSTSCSARCAPKEPETTAGKRSRSARTGSSRICRRWKGARTPAPARTICWPPRSAPPPR